MNPSTPGGASLRDPLTMGRAARAAPSIFSPAGAPRLEEDRLTVDIPAVLKKKVKLEAVRRDSTVKTLVIAALERELTSNEEAEKDTARDSADR
ncbi:hypothetical protein [Brachybacterium kimchii]|uniref:CopG family transcriptional regulator n=1 Tax=Brachybacterium kimchii TaxID=2942909 RepID=A0ABY4N8M9_9MICO|nr:hypothetical protein [Brachybacterium kimchii]UQN30451.1 hypothetical protein M4486_03670 [Brachybacterium kimchii]